MSDKKKELTLSLDRANLALKRDSDRLANNPLEIKLAKSDYDAKLETLAAEKKQLEASVDKLKKEVATIEAKLAE